MPRVRAKSATCSNLDSRGSFMGEVLQMRMSGGGSQGPALIKVTKEVHREPWWTRVVTEEHHKTVHVFSVSGKLWVKSTGQTQIMTSPDSSANKIEEGKGLI